MSASPSRNPDPLRRLGALFFPDDELPLEVRLYWLLCLAGAFLALVVVVPTNIASHLPWQLNLTVAIYGLGSLGLYGLARKGVRLVRTLCVLLIVVLDVCWFKNAGSHGSIGMFLFSASMMFTIFFRGLLRWSLLGLSLANGLALIWLDARFPQLILGYASPADRLPDLLSGFAVSVMACVLMMWIVLASHDRERDRLEKAKAELERSLQEIRTLQGLIPICSWCKKMRNDEGLWQQMEHYITEHCDASFTHGICPECAKKQRDEVGGA